MRNILAICILVFLAMNDSSAQILDVTEILRGSEYQISNDSKQIVDINSRLEITISKKNLITAIASEYPEYAASKNVEDQIESLKNALENQDAILSALQNQVNDIDSEIKFVNLMVDFLEALKQEPFMAERYNELSANFFSIPANSRPGFNMFIFQNLDDDLIKLQEKLENQEDLKYGISMVAFKKDKQGGDRVHIQNFDTYSEREYTTIPRWVTSISEEQKSAFQELAEIAEMNNNKALTIFGQLKEQLLRFLPDISCISEQKNALRNFLTDPNNKEKLSDALEKTGDELIQKVDAYIAFFTSFKSNLKNLEIATVFDLIDQFQELIKNSNTIQIDSSDFEALVSLVDELSDDIKDLTGEVKTCLINIKNQVKGLENTIGILAHQQERYIANSEFGKEVKAFETNNIPEKGHIKLKGTGPRSNGDELEISIYLRIPSEEESTPEKRHLLEEHVYTMQLIGARSEIAVGLIMANPTNEDALNFNLEREFYFAPSASLLLKFGSRKSHFYNEFLDIGVGLNFASTDFDTDGTPEFGTGLIITAFKDVLSVGYNYNVTLNSPYWFFGVNLPFTVPGLPVNTIK